jgi:hypothetical protein
MEHSWLTDIERLFNSPGLYFLKKLTGRDIRRIIIEAWTPREVFDSNLLLTMPLTDDNICEDKDTQIMQIASPISAFAFPLARTGPVNALVSLGIRIPIPETAIDANTIINISLVVTHRFI